MREFFERCRSAWKFEEADRLIVTIAPSGTRQRVTKWKSGFYRIATAADVPIVCGFINYKKKIVGIGPAVFPTGNLEADLKKIQKVSRGPFSQASCVLPQQSFLLSPYKNLLVTNTFSRMAFLRSWEAMIHIS